MKLSRRELAAAAVAAVVAPSGEAQTPQAPPVTDLARTIHDANQRNSETLAKFEIAIATEPAFQFKA